jgi:uncharacterized membrane protein YgcG
VHILSFIFGLMIAIVVIGFIAAAWVVRAIMFRRARAMGWTPPTRPGPRDSYDPGGQFQANDPGSRHGGHHGGWGGFSGGHGGGHHGGGGGGDGGGGGHHH